MFYSGGHNEGFRGFRKKGSLNRLLVLCICLVLVTMTGILSSDSIDDFTVEVKGYIVSGLEPESQEKYFTPEPALFTFPAIPTYSPRKSELNSYPEDSITAWLLPEQQLSDLRVFPGRNKLYENQYQK